MAAARPSAVHSKPEIQYLFVHHFLVASIVCRGFVFCRWLCDTFLVSFHLAEEERAGNLGDNCIQNFNLGRYIIGYTVGNHVLQLISCVAVKLNFRSYIH